MSAIFLPSQLPSPSRGGVRGILMSPTVNQYRSATRRCLKAGFDGASWTGVRTTGVVTPQVLGLVHACQGSANVHDVTIGAAMTVDVTDGVA